MKILAIYASSREESLNKKLVLQTAKLIEEENHEVLCLGIKDFLSPTYDGDFELKAGIPEKINSLASKIRAYDALIISSPEYNYSMPGSLKNIIDWLSRTKPQPFKEKKILLMSASPAMVGGNRGLWALRVPLEALGAFVYPEMFSLALADKAFDDKANLKDTKLLETLRTNAIGFMNKSC